MRSGLALLAAICFWVAAGTNGFQPSGADSDAVEEVIRAVAQTLFVGLVILSLALVHWSDVAEFLDVPASPNPTVAPDEADHRKS